jgi:tRNA (cmo5U34)-methyltransferase
LLFLHYPHGRTTQKGFNDEDREKHVDHYPELYIAFGEILPRTDRAFEILDLGAGTGLELEWLFQKIPNARVTCIDISTKMLNELRRKFVKFKDQITIIEASYLDYRFEMKKYDYVISIQSFHHMLREDKILLYRRIYNSLGDKGTFIEGDFIVYAKDEEDQYINDAQKLGMEKGINNFHDYHIDIPFTKETQMAAYQSAGFTNIEIKFDKDYALLCECK